MLNLKRVAVTGIPSSGKSSVCQFFKELGSQVESADAIVHHLLTPNSRVGQQVVNLLGTDIIAKDQLDRKIIAQRVFSEPTVLRKLEAILHPEVRLELRQRYQQALEQQQKGKPCPLFVAEIPLLFEGKMADDFDATIAVVADKERCVQRFSELRGFDKTEYSKRLAQQWSQEDKQQHADYVLHNNGTLQELKAAVQVLFNQLTSH